MSITSRPMTIFLFACLVLLLLTAPALALITTGKGNAPHRDDNWPAGAVDVANLKTRIGWWEGPPFGGGRTEFLYRGDATAFQEALDAFGKTRAPELRLIIQEGPHENGILKESVDWTLALWNPRSWHQLYNNPTSVTFSDDPSGAFRNPVDPPLMTVYVAGPDGKGIDWTKIKPPPNVKITDKRATSNGYARADGSVVRGDVYDMITSKPIPGASVVLDRYDATQKKYVTVATTNADPDGRFELKNLPAGGGRVIVAASGYVPRVAARDSLGVNALEQHTVLLATPATVSGTITDTQGKPIAGATVRPDDLLAADGRGYVLPEDPQAQTDAQGKFEFKDLPTGHLRLFIGAKDYHNADVMKIYKSPSIDLKFQLGATGTVRGTVLRPDGKPPKDAQVSVDPEGDPIGKWGGSMNVNPDGTFEFSNVPPGKYTASANPGMARIGKDPTAKPIEVKPGKTTEVTLTKK